MTGTTFFVYLLGDGTLYARPARCWRRRGECFEMENFSVPLPQNRGFPNGALGQATCNDAQCHWARQKIPAHWRSDSHDRSSTCANIRCRNTGLSHTGRKRFYQQGLKACFDGYCRKEEPRGECWTSVMQITTSVLGERS